MAANTVQRLGLSSELGGTYTASRNFSENYTAECVLGIAPPLLVNIVGDEYATVRVLENISPFKDRNNRFSYCA